MYALVELDAPVVPMPQEVFKKNITNPTGTLVTLPSQTITYPDIKIKAVATSGTGNPNPDISGAPNPATWTQMKLKGVMATAAPVTKATPNPTRSLKGFPTVIASTVTPQCSLGSA